MVQNRLILSFLSGILLTLSFPSFSFGWLAWIALVPLFWAIDSCQRVRQALSCGFVAGITFFLTSIYWFFHVAPPALVLMVILETLFVVLFAWIAFQLKNILCPVVFSVSMALAWLCCEIIRSEIPIFGFGWNLLGYSQAAYPLILQSANTVGVYGLSFAIALVNAAGFFFARNWVCHREKIKPAVLSVLVMSITFLMICGHGLYYLNRHVGIEKEVRLTVLQGNVAQSIKWRAEARDKIIELYQNLTQLSLYDNTQLIIWPEASFPGYFNRDRQAEEIRMLGATLKIPLLIGSPHFVNPETVYNSAYLVDADGVSRQRYDKVNLVPFGEYVPLQPMLSWLEPVAYSMGVSDFTPGEKRHVFAVNQQFFFSVLICFEDVFGTFARSFVARGAEFLAVITNDAWFEDTAAPHQHLQASIFRAVENGVAVVRAANTGVSAIISPRGRILDKVQDQEGKATFVMGKTTVSIPVWKGSTLYTRFGFVLPYLAFIPLGLLLLFRGLRREENS